MKRMKVSLQHQYNLTNYQMEQLKYLVLSLLSEFSKLLILGFLFRANLCLYFFSILILLFMRKTTGGLHCKTYLSCLALSFLYLYMSINILPMIPISKTGMLGVLMVCSIVTYHIGLVTSIYRPKPSNEVQKKCKIQIFVIIFCYLILTYLSPENIYITTGFWIISLHTIQLGIAKLKSKGVMNLKLLNKNNRSFIYKLISACISYSLIIRPLGNSMLLFGELPYPKEEDSETSN